MINITLGIDSATAYNEGGTINLSRYATEVAKIVRPQFPDLRFRFSVVEDDNAETKIEFNSQDLEYSVTADEIRTAVAEAEGTVFPDESVWNK